MLVLSQYVEETYAAELPGAAAQELGGVRLLHVLGEHEHRQVRQLLAGRERRPQPLVAEAGRQPYVEDGDVRAVLQEQRQDLGAGGRDPGDLVAGGGQQQDQALPQEGVVLGDHHTHGSSTSITVGPPRGLVSRTVPSSAAAPA